jgi:hypothetical protein
MGYNFGFGPMSKIGSDLAQIAFHLCHSAAHHVFDQMPSWRPCTEHDSPLLPRVILLATHPARASHRFGAPEPLPVSLTHSLLSPSLSAPSLALLLVSATMAAS